MAAFLLTRAGENADSESQRALDQFAEDWLGQLVQLPSYGGLVQKNRLVRATGKVRSIGRGFVPDRAQPTTQRHRQETCPLRAEDIDARDARIRGNGIRGRGMRIDEGGTTGPPARSA